MSPLQPSNNSLDRLTDRAPGRVMSALVAKEESAHLVGSDPPGGAPVGEGVVLNHTPRHYPSTCH